VIRVKNLTISLEENLIKASREYAQRNNTSLNAMIQDYLMKTVLKNPNDLAKEMIRLMNEAGGDSKGHNWTREELYDV
jgi:hypothetical protein